MELEKIPSLLAVITFSALSLTVAHEWGYFGVIGTDFQSFFTTYDYISELLVAMGPAFVGLAGLLALQVAVVRSDNFEPKRLGDAAKSRWGQVVGEWFYEIVWSMIFISSLLFSDQTRRWSFYLVAALLWMRAVLYIYSHENFSNFKKTAIGLLLFGLPAIMIGAYGVGRDGAYADLKATDTQYRLQLKNRAVSQSVALLRLLERGALVFDPTSKIISFQPKEDIALLERNAPTWETRSFVCRHLGWACPKPSAQ